VYPLSIQRYGNRSLQGRHDHARCRGIVSPPQNGHGAQLHVASDDIGCGLSLRFHDSTKPRLGGRVVVE